MKCRVVISSQRMGCPKHPFQTVGKGRKDCIRLGSQEEASLALHQIPSTLPETLLNNGRQSRAPTLFGIPILSSKYSQSGKGHHKREKKKREKKVDMRGIRGFLWSPSRTFSFLFYLCFHNVFVQVVNIANFAWGFA